MKTIGDIIYSPTELKTKWYFGVWALLLGFLALTWRLAYAHLGSANLPLAMGVALIKSILVLWYFMQLRSSPKSALLLFSAGLVMFSLLILLTMTDFLTRGP